MQERAIEELKSGVREMGALRVTGGLMGRVDESLTLIELLADHAAQAVKVTGV